MELILAKNDLKDKPKKVSLEKIEKELKESGEKIFYFDRENPHKELVKLVEYFEERGFSVYLREVKYGLDDNNYIYEVHILK